MVVVTIVVIVIVTVIVSVTVIATVYFNAEESCYFNANNYNCGCYHFDFDDYHRGLLLRRSNVLVRSARGCIFLQRQYVFVYIYIYMYRYIYVYVYIYIYIYILTRFMLRFGTGACWSRRRFALASARRDTTDPRSASPRSAPASRLPLTTPKRSYVYVHINK